MKKLLAMVLALVMTMSLVTIASATKLSDYSDSEKVDSTYAPAVDLLTQSGVIAGYPDGTFQPKGTVTRAEMAKMICVALLGNEQASKLVASRQVFTDVPTTNWAAGYIDYCYSQGIISGYGNGKFGPSDNVTGYQAAKMVLVAKGYTKSGAYQGTGWEVAVATDAMKEVFSNATLGSTCKTASYNAAATREEAAYYIFNGFTTSSVQYVNALDINMPTGRYVLGWLDDTEVKNDKTFGRPYTLIQLYLNAYHGGKTLKYELAAKPVLTYTTKVTECDVASALKVSSSVTFAAGNYKVDGVPQGQKSLSLFNTVSTIGDQGMLTEIYKVDGTYYMVQINTYLAKVGTTSAAINDANGHEIIAAYTNLAAYMTAGGETTPLQFKTKSFGQFAKDSYVLITRYFDQSNQGYPVVASVQAVTPVTGKSTLYTYGLMDNTLTVDGVAKNTACTYFLGSELTIGTRQFFYDTYGNLIGDIAVPGTAAVYALVTDIAYEHAGLSNGYVDANLLGFDGTALSAVVIRKINNVNVRNADNTLPNGDPTSATVSSNKQSNGAYYLKSSNAQNYFFKYTKNTAGSYDLDLVPVTYVASTSITKGNPVLFEDADELVVADGKTVALIKNGSSYTSVTGYTNLDSMSNVELYYITAENAFSNYINRVSYVVIDVTNAVYSGSTVNALITSTTPAAVGAKTTSYSFYVDGQLKTYTTTEASNAAVVAVMQGVVLNEAQPTAACVLKLNANGELLAVENDSAIKEITISMVQGTVITSDGTNSTEKNKQYDLSAAKFYKITRFPVGMGLSYTGTPYVVEGSISDMKVDGAIAVHTKTGASSHVVVDVYYYDAAVTNWN